ncbi:hypothetical protein [Antrihabitans sp. YC2-6]|uniref:hypothetical protein n=1 Tax=Antrihabitans sp. YC2-6 TaxID=2799498 RepID=UPI001F466B6B|nr:hypothetical protein [Antrihabitans sp. YC2-6]
MTAMWFGLAAIALIGAGVLLYVDHIQRQRVGRVRQIWAKTQGFTYTPADPNLPSSWRRAALSKQDYLSAVDIVSGVRRGEQFFLFDLEDTATIIAVRREIGSDVDIDLRLKSTPPPKDSDLELLGAIGHRIMFATDLEIARRICDQRMVAFTEALPPKLQMLWSEGMWTLGSMPIATAGREWDGAIDAVAKLSGILHALPPASEPQGLNGQTHDPGRPRSRQAVADEAAAAQFDGPTVRVDKGAFGDDAPTVVHAAIRDQPMRDRPTEPRVVPPPRYPAPERARPQRPVPDRHSAPPNN